MTRDKSWKENRRKQRKNKNKEREVFGYNIDGVVHDANNKSTTKFRRNGTSTS